MGLLVDGSLETMLCHPEALIPPHKTTAVLWGPRFGARDLPRRVSLNCLQYGSFTKNLVYEPKSLTIIYVAGNAGNWGGDEEKQAELDNTVAFKM